MVGSEKQLLALLPGLSNRKKQLAFGLLVCERIMPALITFSKETGFDASCYLRAKDAVWAALENGAVDQALNQACIRSAPDTEEFTHELTSYALNTALAMSEIVEFTLDGCADHITHTLTLVRDSIHLYLSSLDPVVVSSPERDSRIASHPLMQLEQQREEDDIKFLSPLPDQFDNNVISALRARVDGQGPLLPFARAG